MTPPTVIGIDPGKEGAVAILHADTAALIAVDDMPLDADKLAALLNAVEEYRTGGWMRFLLDTADKGVGL